jgi:hypothetical protein
VPSAPWVDRASFWASVVTILSLAVTVGAFIYAARQFTLARRTSSAGALIPLHESLRQAWLQFRSAKDEAEKRHTFADIFNLLEMGCAIFHDRLLVGRCGDLLEAYLCGVFGLIQQSADAREHMSGLVVTPRTFSNAAEFLASHKREIALASRTEDMGAADVAPHS